MSDQKGLDGVLSMIENTNVLKGIWLLGCNVLNDYLLEKICRTYIKLKCINITSCCHINDIGFKSIYTHCRELKCLEAKMLVNLTDNCAIDVENQNELEVLDLTYHLYNHLALHGGYAFCLY